jgi:ABC-type transport system substrate-binding protein
MCEGPLEEELPGMSRTSKWLPLLALFAVTAIVFAACAGAASPTPTATSAGATATAGASASAAAASTEPFEAISYPEDGSSACDVEGYEGIMGSINAPDQYTVEFNLCQPDAAFLSKIAFTSLAINDAGYLEETGGGGDQLVRSPVGTGPYKLQTWTPEQEIILATNENYWGEAPLTPTAIVRWSAEAAQRLVELQSGQVDGIDNPGSDDFETIEGSADLKLFPRTALNIFYIGFNNNQPPFDDEAVRQAFAKGINREQIVENFYPSGSEVATHFTPCSIPGGCTGEAWYEFDAAAAKSELEAAGFDFSQTYPIHLRDVVRGYLPEPTVVAQEIQQQLKTNLGVNTTIDVRDENTYLTEASEGKLPGLHLLGWGADYPDVTNFLDVHFGVGASEQFGEKYEDITGPLQEGAATADQATRDELYAQANDAIREHVPMIPVAHGGSATAFRADVEGAHSSPLGNEALFAMKAGDRQQLVWLQNGEPGGLYCADETDGESLRVCEQIMEPLYSYEIAGTAPEPLLAEECTPNEDSTQWTCTLRQGVTFHNGAAFDATDVVMSYAVQWDAEHPLHVGKEDSGLFEYWTYLFAGFLNPPPPAEG